MSIKKVTGLSPREEEIIVDRIKKSAKREGNGISLEDFSDKLDLV